MKQTLKSKIISYVQGWSDQWVWGGVIESEVAKLAGAKPSNVSRQCRKLVEEDLLEVQRVDNPNGSGNKVVQYRFKPIVVDIPTAYNPVFDNKQETLI